MYAAETQTQIAIRSGGYLEHLKWFQNHMPIKNNGPSLGAPLRKATGATTSLYYRRTRSAENHHNPSAWGLLPGGRGSQHFH